MIQIGLPDYFLVVRSLLIHEALHAEYPSIKGNSEEKWVDDAARNISKLL